MDDTHDKFTNSEFIRICAHIKPILPLLEAERFDEAARQLSEIFKELPTPGLHQLIGCCQFMLGNEDGAAKSLMLNSAITAFHKSRGIQALEEAKRRFCG
jgi:hypothetical protein